MHLGRSEHGPLAFSSPEPIVSWSCGGETRGSGDENAKGPCSLRPRCIARPGRLQIKPSGSGDENGALSCFFIFHHFNLVSFP